MFLIFYSIMLLLSREPKTQIAGVSIVADLDGLAYKHVPGWKKLKTFLNVFSVSKVGGVSVVRQTHWAYTDFYSTRQEAKDP
jgi:hypothetical protein